MKALLALADVLDLGERAGLFPSEPQLSLPRVIFARLRPILIRMMTARSELALVNQIDSELRLLPLQL